MSPSGRDRPRQHLLSINDLVRPDLERILDLTESFAEVSERAIPRVPALRGKTVAWLFYEDSTRTRLSFEAAAKQLSADTLNFTVRSSSVNKGESVRDTVQTIDAMGIDAIVVRHSCAGVPHRVGNWIDASVINAGDGRHEHPTQALLDLYTARTHLGDLDGARVAIVGDILHSRVARSDVLAFAAMGAQVTLVAPRPLLPSSLDGWPVTVTHDFDDILGEIDICYLLRMQLERQASALVPSLREFRAEYGLNSWRADRLAEGALIMHPGPMNRGVEIDGDVADRPNAVITEQVANGVAVRMAVLFLLLGSGLDQAAGQKEIAA
ncbi:MAG: aspartate carbamoyltransferase catalytic subunit [Acidimicrobiaceae bacterium]|nr:aspartate carbamoyltransferase catalytic subunit [Acidimicrobiaceae bacterium]MDE0494330.1 aspartate carbamoyltransferase catalytic subunit [Acidimicrobiaceae bacterium]MDE0666468.1 aspartate carbamoyltransferase catalytic subunit [Acidimicrobiaceae bacterium]MXY11718.1 aspartate carbamoyltransferase catalytic subunit [Acidimicrobiaceae bacterium]MXZ65015.1 aspartate carbamoyltransferase catalytic subunit [Acidimicrobiaceae bacterium]